MVTSDRATGPAILFFEKRPPSVMVCFFAAAADKADASSSGLSGVATTMGDKSLRYHVAYGRTSLEFRARAARPHRRDRSESARLPGSNARRENAAVFACVERRRSRRLGRQLQG